MVAEAARLVAEGSSISKALKAAAALYGVSASSVRRYAADSGAVLERSTSVPLSEDTTLATAARRAYGLDDLRALQHDTMEVVAMAVAGIRAATMGPDGKYDDALAVALLPELGRATTVLKRLGDLDERLDRRGAPLDTPSGGKPEDEQNALLSEALAAREEWRVIHGNRKEA